MVESPEPAAAATTPPSSSDGGGDGKKQLRSWLNKILKVELSDGRTLIGTFLCTDKDRNVILGSCTETCKDNNKGGRPDPPRNLGLAMVPGKHIVSIHLDDYAATAAASTRKIS